MKENLQQLKKEFEIIMKKGYIKGLYNNSASIGRTLENELNLSRNTMEIPDYKGIEIKTRRMYSKSFITLFTAVPDGAIPKEIERLTKIYGIPYKNDKRFNSLYANVYGNVKKYAGVKYQYKLDVDKIHKKIFLCIYDRMDKLIERKVYWSFFYLESKIMLKLKTLAIINVFDKNICGWNYFKYYKINFYKLKDFDAFLELITQGIIRLTIKVDIHKDEKNYGKIYDHGCGFCIQEKDICKLYNRIYIE